MSSFTGADYLLLLTSLWLMLLLSLVRAIPWDHSAYLSPDYRLLWTLKQQDITFEVQVRTSGYIGLGFSPDGAQSGADIAIGWIDQGQTYFQDRHMKKSDDGEPFVDPQQDYELLLGYENSTHTVMRFRRKLNTCDQSHDIVITNGTMRIIYMYHSLEPAFGSVLPGSLPSPKVAYRGYVPLSLTHRVPDIATPAAPPLAQPRSAASASSPTVLSASNSREPNSLATGSRSDPFWLELRHEDVELPEPDETHHWCKLFELSDFRPRHHLIRYEPIFETPRSRDYLQHMILYECQGAGPQLLTLSRQGGHVCNNSNNPQLPCNAVVAAWSRGSQGFTFPADAGYPFDARHDRFYLLESHYNNPVRSEGEWEAAVAARHLGPVVDNSGLRLMFTGALRQHDAGVISLGMDPNWRHIIPPGHEEVTTEGHCIDECTQRSLPAAGISIFAVLMQTYNIGSEIRLRQIRKREELLPITVDDTVHAGYSEWRQVAPGAKVLPGDSLIVECKYNSSVRQTITLGGVTTREEACNAMVVYYPRQRQLATCHSMPSLPTVLHSLGIEELSANSLPVTISSPKSLTGMSLEDRLLSYDWKLQFDSFQRVMQSGSFAAICLDARNQLMSGTETREHFRPTVTKFWRTAATGNGLVDRQCPAAIGAGGGDDLELQRRRGGHADDTGPDSNTVYVTEMATRRKNFGADDAEVESMSLSGTTRLGQRPASLLAMVAISAAVVAVGRMTAAGGGRRVCLIT